MVEYGVIFDKGDILVIGVIGGVGFVVVVLLVKVGFLVVVCIGKKEYELFLKIFGVSKVIICDELLENKECFMFKE